MIFSWLFLFYKRLNIVVFMKSRNEENMTSCSFELELSK